MLRSDDGFDDVCKIIHVWESFHAKKDIVECRFSRCRIFGALNNYAYISILQTVW